MTVAQYEYRCTKCFHSLETSIRSNEHKCPQCKKIMNRIYHPPAIRFIGGGFSREFRG